MDIYNKRYQKSMKIKITEKELDKISNIIMKKYPQINYGGCGVFAKAFHDVTKLPFILIFDGNRPDEDPPIHVMIKLSNNKLYDGEGIKTIKEVKDYYKNEFDNLVFVSDYDGSILQNSYNDLGQGLSVTCHISDYPQIKEIIEKTLNMKKIKLSESDLRKLVENKINELYDSPIIKQQYENELGDNIGNTIDKLINAYDILELVIEKDLNIERRNELTNVLNGINDTIEKLQEISPEVRPPFWSNQSKQD